MSNEWLAKEHKVEQAKKWVSMKLREFDGPLPGQSAVLVVNVRPHPEEPETGFVMVGCLPDMPHEALCAGLEQWISDLREGSLKIEPHGLDEDEEPKQ